MREPMSLTNHLLVWILCTMLAVVGTVVIVFVVDYRNDDAQSCEVARDSYDTYRDTFPGPGRTATEYDRWYDEAGRQHEMMRTACDL